MKYFIADTHFGWKSMHGRSFPTTAEHDAELVRRWNAVVTPDDEVYVIGDFIFDVDVAESVLEQLKGTIYLVPGDHDWKLMQSQSVRHINILPEIFEIKRSVTNPPIIICHWPFDIWKKSHYGSYHLYGHLHNGVLPSNGKSMCISCDQTEFTPVSLGLICEAMRGLPDNKNLIKDNQHETETGPTEIAFGVDGTTGPGQTNGFMPAGFSQSCGRHSR